MAPVGCEPVLKEGLICKPAGSCTGACFGGIVEGLVACGVTAF